MIKSEREFADFLGSQGKTWIHHPKRFKFDGKSYQTDFYCPEDDTYYEVKSHLGLGDAIRLLKFKKFHPHLKFKVVSPNGYSFYSKNSGRYLALLERKLNLIKSKDILEISLKEYYENIRELHIWPSTYGNNKQRVFPCTPEMIKQINIEKEKLEKKLI